MQDIRAVVFDWGGVLIDNPAAGLMAYCAKAVGVPVEHYTRVHDRHSEAFQKGLISEQLFWERVCGDLGRPLLEPPFWAKAFLAVYSPRGEVFALVAQLHGRHYRTALLSNTEAPAMEYFRALRYPMFDTAVFSCAEGMCKPQREIYEITARKLRTPPGQCVLIDDKLPFVDGARSAGMQGIVYESLEQVKRDLAALGVRAE